MCHCPGSSEMISQVRILLFGLVGLPFAIHLAKSHCKPGKRKNKHQSSKVWRLQIFSQQICWSRSKIRAINCHSVTAKYRLALQTVLQLLGTHKGTVHLQNWTRLNQKLARYETSTYINLKLHQILSSWIHLINLPNNNKNGTNTTCTCRK